MGAASPRETGDRYWVIVLVLLVLGALTIFSLGLYFWFMAVAMVLLSPFRSRPRIFRSGLTLFLGFLLGYLLLAPWSCTQSITSNPVGEQTLSEVVCSSPIGIEYSGPEPFEPSRAPALIAGGASGLVAAAIAWAIGGRTDQHGFPRGVRLDPANSIGDPAVNPSEKTQESGSAH